MSYSHLGRGTGDHVLRTRLQHKGDIRASMQLNGGLLTCHLQAIQRQRHRVGRLDDNGDAVLRAC